MLQGGGGRGVAWEPLLVARTEQSDALREQGAGSRSLEQLDVPEPELLEPGARRPDARVAPLGQHDAFPRAARPVVQALAKCHFGNFCRSACRTAGDRKSTRLNSSHLVISYAVFCLKKKKKLAEPSYE